MSCNSTTNKILIYWCYYSCSSNCYLCRNYEFSSIVLKWREIHTLSSFFFRHSGWKENNANFVLLSLTSFSFNGSNSLLEMPDSVSLPSSPSQRPFAALQNSLDAFIINSVLSSPNSITTSGLFTFFFFNFFFLRFLPLYWLNLWS